MTDWRIETEPFGHATHQQVLGLDVSVHDVEAVKVFDGTDQVVQHATGVSLCVLVGGRDGVEKISTLIHKHAHKENEWKKIVIFE